MRYVVSFAPGARPRDELPATYLVALCPCCNEPLGAVGIDAYLAALAHVCRRPAVSDQAA